MPKSQRLICVRQRCLHDRGERAQQGRPVCGVSEVLQGCLPRNSGGNLDRTTLAAIHIDVSPHLRQIWFAICLFLGVDALMRHRVWLKKSYDSLTEKQKHIALGVVVPICILAPVLLWIGLGKVLWKVDNRARLALVGIRYAPMPTNTGLILPPGFGGYASMFELEVKCTGTSNAQDIYWHGGVAISDILDDSGEDALFEKLTKTPLANWAEMKPAEVDTLRLEGNNPDQEDPKNLKGVWEGTKVEYVILKGSFHDELGPRPDIELCEHFGGRKDPRFEFNSPCNRHNLGIDIALPKKH